MATDYRFTRLCLYSISCMTFLLFPLPLLELNRGCDGEYLGVAGKLRYPHSLRHVNLHRAEEIIFAGVILAQE